MQQKRNLRKYHFKTFVSTEENSPYLCEIQQHSCGWISHHGQAGVQGGGRTAEKSIQVLLSPGQSNKQEIAICQRDKGTITQGCIPL